MYLGFPISRKGAGLEGGGEVVRKLVANNDDSDWRVSWQVSSTIGGTSVQLLCQVYAKPRKRVYKQRNLYGTFLIAGEII